MFDYEKEMLKQHEVDKINACARKLIKLGYFTSEQLGNTLREYGVARGYFEQMYHLEWGYVWEKKASLTWREFLFQFICGVDHANIFNNDIPGRLDDIHKVDYFCEEFKYNEQTHTVDHYHQQYRWKVAFKKKDTINL
jgi:hypothetical protein